MTTAIDHTRRWRKQIRRLENVIRVLGPEDHDSVLAASAITVLRERIARFEAWERAAEGWIES